MTWHEIADILAARLWYQVCDEHAAWNLNPDCPKCLDTAAYEAWAKKSGRRHSDGIDNNGPTVNIFDLAAAD